MTPETRATILDALATRHDTLIEDLRMRRLDWYARGDWRGDLHRKQMARDLMAVRRARREIRPRPWPSWYSTPDGALAAFHREGR